MPMCEAVRLDQVSERPLNSDAAPAGLLAGCSPAPVVKQNFLCTRFSPWLSGQLPPWRAGLKSSLKSHSWVEQRRQLPGTAPFYLMHPELHAELHETWKLGSLWLTASEGSRKGWQADIQVRLLSLTNAGCVPRCYYLCVLLSRSERRVPASLNGGNSSACQWWTGGLRIVADKTNGSRWPYEESGFGRGRVSVIVQVTEKERLLLSEKKLHLPVSKCSLLAIQRKKQRKIFDNDSTLGTALIDWVRGKHV